MTTDEAITLIEEATGPGVLFGADPAGAYRRFARLTHPDAHPGDGRAAAAFAKLAALWHDHKRQRKNTHRRLVAAGDIAKLYEHEQGLLKIARDPGDNDLLEREATALTALRSRGDKRYLAYVPTFAGSQLHHDPASGVRRRANLIGRLDGFVSLAEVRAACPDGLDPRDAAWMWRRLLVAIGFAHRAGVIHAAVVPEHVLIHPAGHGLVLVDWCYSVAGPAGRAAAMPGKYADWYPPEVHRREPVGPDLDIYLATKCLTKLMGEQAPPPLVAFARGCVRPNPRGRPQDAWRLLGELDDVLGRLYGARKFRPFTMPST
jgi:hypothetical protein